jgi:hypothetical protein
MVLGGLARDEGFADEFALLVEVIGAPGPDRSAVPVGGSR